MSKIDRFSGSYQFLSNFYICDIVYDGLTYPSVEHAYQAAKTLSIADREVIQQTISPKIAKKLGKHLEIRSDWNDIKLSIMTELVYQKFTVHNELADKLMSTADAELIEGNWWGDRYWGQCNGIGENYLGKILMSVRKHIQEDLKCQHRPSNNL